jgi:hypothetical protein
MSTTAIGLMDGRFKEFISSSPSSEEFTLDPDGAATTFDGIYDEAYENENEDAGHVRQRSLTPRILVGEILSGMVRDAEVTDGTNTWKISRADKDRNGVPVIWLY